MSAELTDQSSSQTQTKAENMGAREYKKKASFRSNTENHLESSGI
jgi:hypothetical protein